MLNYMKLMKNWFYQQKLYINNKRHIFSSEEPQNK